MSTRKRKKKQPPWRSALRDAIDEAGSQSALARLISPDNWEKRRLTITMAVRSEGTISAELARDIAAVTSIPKHRFRPDLWGEGE